jgi:hypothetical protein
LYLGRTKFGSLDDPPSERALQPNLIDWDAASGMMYFRGVGYIVSAPLPAPTGMAALTLAHPSTAFPTPSGLASLVLSMGSYTPGKGGLLQQLGASGWSLRAGRFQHAASATS